MLFRPEQQVQLALDQQMMERSEGRGGGTPPRIGTRSKVFGGKAGASLFAFARILLLRLAAAFACYSCAAIPRALLL